MLESLKSVSFGQPFWLLLLALVPLAAWLRGASGCTPAVRYSAVSILSEISTPVRRNPRQWLRYLGLIALTLAIVAMARPREDMGRSPDKREGVDIVFCVDVSGSMDMKVFPFKGGRVSNREALIMAIGQFVDQRPNDRFGMIGFAEDTYLMSPLTIDAEWIKAVLKEIELKSGTAIGEGILSSVHLLKESKSKSRVIVVASDGGNNRGIAPAEAAEVARKENIRVHTVQLLPPNKVSPANANNVMGQIAAKTGGQFYQASSLDKVVSIYRDIDRMERTQFEQQQQRLYNELYVWFAAPAAAILLLSWIGHNTLWLQVP